MGKRILPDPIKTRNRTYKRTDNTDNCNEDISRSAVTNTPSNGIVSYEDLKMCPNRPMDAGYWVHEDDNGVCIKEKKN